MPKRSMKQELLAEMLQESLTRTEFEDIAKMIAEKIKQIDDRNIKHLESMKIAIDNIPVTVNSKTDDGINSFKQELQGIVNKAISDIRDEIKKKTAEIDNKLFEVKDGKDADEEAILQRLVESIKIPTIEEIKDDLPIMGEEVRDSLELLKGDDRLDVSAIKGIKTLINKFIKNKPTFIGSGSSAGGHIVKAHDLSGSLNGVLKTFSMPAFWRIISIHSSNFPGIMRPDIDFTVNSSNMTITFTDEIDASTILSAGSALIVTYSE